MKKSKKNYLLIALVVLLIALAVGYAAFSQTLQITGTAKAQGSWDIHFTNESIDKNDTDNTVTLSDSDHKLTVAVKLTKPGDKRTVTVDIVNEGSIDATLKSFTVTAKDGTGTTINGSNGVYTYNAIKMTLEQATTGETLAAETGSKTYTMTFEWPSDYTTTEGTIDDTATFDITFDYEQAA